MKLKHILETINVIEYEGLKEVIVPMNHLGDLKREINRLRTELTDERLAHRSTRAEAFKLMASSEPIVQKFDNYA